MSIILLLSWSSNNVNTSFVVLAFKHVCLSNYGGYECIPISPHCAWRTGIHSFCNMAKGPPKLWSAPDKKKRYSKNFWCSCFTKLHWCKGYYAVSFVFVKLDFILKALLLYFCLDLVAKEIGLNIVLTTICLQDLQDLDSDWKLQKTLVLIIIWQIPISNSIISADK